ncbi:hypothetical protein BSKO_11909 [Bryopsis sp. KO-2023]|nr:hypothetical protein BSKO_11909 [Bryopsis sp. KO-2023]
MSGVVSRKGAWLALLSLATFAVVTTECYEECTAGSCDAFELGKTDYTTIKLPGIEDFRNGLDYSTGRRRGAIFSFTYNGAKAGAPEFFYSSPFDDLTYLIPDQVDATNWASSCSSLSGAQSTSHSSFRSFQESESKGILSEYDQKTDIGVTVPVKGAELSMSTQTRNNLGYGTSKASGDFASAMISGQRSMVSITASNARWTVQWKSFDKKSDPIDPKSYLTGNFNGTVNNLKKVCKQGSIDMAWRMSGNKGSELSKCERAAAELVDRFGTHYNDRAEYGGKTSQSYFYNEHQMDETQKSNMESTSKSSMGFLFFMKTEETTKAREDIKTMENKEVVKESRMYTLGGDFGTESVGEWCTSISKAPAIIANTRLVPIADLIEEGSLARTAVAFAGMDEWVCNGRGSYVVININTGEGGCLCKSNDSFYLDEFCAPESPKCYDGSKVVECHFEKILVTYSSSYTFLWRDDGTGGRHYTSFWKPVLGAKQALVGSVAVKGYKQPVQSVMTIHTSTSPEVAREAIEFERVWESSLIASKKRASVFRPVCPPGFSSISDFGQDDYEWPHSYRNTKILPCIANWCIRKCAHGMEDWIWNSRDTRLWYLATWWKMRGTDVGKGGGFFRSWTTDMDGKNKEIDNDLLNCLEPDCVIKF